MATSAWPTSSRRGSRAKVASPAYLGTTVASTGPTVPPETIRGTGSVMSSVPLGSVPLSSVPLSSVPPRSVPPRSVSLGRLVYRAQFPLAGADRGLFGGQVQGAREDKVQQAG